MIWAIRKITPALLLVLTAALSADEPRMRPQFSDFPVKEIYRGTPAVPKLATPGERMFRTRIRFGAKAKVEFAGHYTVPRWGCGTGCSGLVIVDSISGRVYEVPFSVVELPGSWEESQDSGPPERMEFHPDSRLMKFDMCPNEHDCGFYDYLMVDGKGLKLLRKELLPKQFQTD